MLRVLMQTRNEKVRPKILGLKVMRYLVEHLKEEYMVFLFLPETIPFLVELLDDAELSVKALEQDILKEMETLSGESLRQYL
jgi:U3 small nucleolar RNA-associated protein 10